MKTATRNQTEKLKDLRDRIKISNDKDAKISMFDDVQKLLTDIDFMSSYCTNFTGDLLRYKSQRVITMENALTDILESAIEDYS